MHEHQVEQIRTTEPVPASAASNRGICNAGPGGLLQLQRRYGNRYVQRLLGLSRKGEGEAEIDPTVELAITQARGGGRALDSGVRRQMEHAFGSDFSGVRIHTGSQSDALNKNVNAIAFTTGQDIFFRDSAYDPGSRPGKELLAHELTHVVQQGGSAVQGKLRLGAADDPYEREADSVARAVVANMEGGDATSSVQRCACGGPAGSGGECEACQQKREAAQRQEVNGTTPQALQRQDDGDGADGSADNQSARTSSRAPSGQLQLQRDYRSRLVQGLVTHTLAFTTGRDILRDLRHSPGLLPSLQRKGECSECRHKNEATSHLASKLVLAMLHRQDDGDEEGAQDAAVSAGNSGPLDSDGGGTSADEQDDAGSGGNGGSLDSDGGDTSADTVVPDTLAANQFQTDCSSLSYRDCKTGVYKCGYGGSGTCGWTGIAGKCKCLGASQPEEPVKKLLPTWLLLLLSAAAIALIVACFASGVCEAGAIVAAAGAATAAIVIGILKAAGVQVQGDGA